ncbi:MAG: hypothetical protein U0264_16620 [Candidatus Kapaibacterium sp.]
MSALCQRYVSVVSERQNKEENGSASSRGGSGGVIQDVNLRQPQAVVLQRVPVRPIRK